jgi:integrase/recombinase XerD
MDCDLDSAVDLFLGQVSTEKGLARNTLEAYGRDLRAFVEAMERLGRGRAADIERGDIVRYLDHLTRAGLAPSSRVRALSAVRGFFKYCLREGLASANPTREVRSGRKGRPIPKQLSPGEVDTLIASVDGDDPRSLRDRAMYELLYASGLRVSELVGLATTRVNLREGYLTVVGKGSKERAVPVGRRAVTAIRRYPPTAARCSTQREEPASSCEPAASLSPGRVWKRLGERAVAAGIRRVSPTFSATASPRTC